MRRITFRLSETADADLLEYLDSIPPRALSAQIRWALQRQWLGDPAGPGLIHAIQSLTTAIEGRLPTAGPIMAAPTTIAPLPDEQQRQAIHDLFAQAGAFDD